MLVVSTPHLGMGGHLHTRTHARESSGEQQQQQQERGAVAATKELRDLRERERHAVLCAAAAERAAVNIASKQRHDVSVVKHRQVMRTRPALVRP
jgi:hypothetical protein